MHIPMEPAGAPAGAAARTAVELSEPARSNDKVMDFMMVSIRVGGEKVKSRANPRESRSDIRYQPTLENG